MKTLRVYLDDGVRLDFYDVRRFIAGKSGIAFWYADQYNLSANCWAQGFFAHTKIAGFALVQPDAPEPKEVKSYGPLRNASNAGADVDVDPRV